MTGIASFPFWVPRVAQFSRACFPSCTALWLLWLRTLNSDFPSWLPLEALPSFPTGEQAPADRKSLPVHMALCQHRWLPVVLSSCGSWFSLDGGLGHTGGPRHWEMLLCGEVPLLCLGFPHAFVTVEWCQKKKKSFSCCCGLRLIVRQRTCQD